MSGHYESAFFFNFRSDGGSCVYSQLNNDVGLMKLADPVMLNDYVNTICLPAQSKTAPVGHSCYVTGRVLAVIPLKPTRTVLQRQSQMTNYSHENSKLYAENILWE